MVVCKSCKKKFKDLLKHLRKSDDCQVDYDMTEVVKNSKVRRLELKKQRNSEYYTENKQSIREKQAIYKQVNKDDIKEQKAEYYNRTKGLQLQKKRFYKHFTKAHALNYITSHQDHLFLHTEGECQPESIKDINHSIEHCDSKCQFCKEPQGVKIIGVNRLVCLSCKRAECTVCNCEVSPDPELGCFHYSPDSGGSLGFLNYCPLYSNPWFPHHDALHYHKNRRDCKICRKLKEEYPEYEIFGQVETQTNARENWGILEKQDIFMYTCNLCESNFQFTCEFDLHMRNHTKYGKNIAIVGLDSRLSVDTAPHNRVSDGNFAAVEAELMKISGVSAVLAVFGKQRFTSISLDVSVEDIEIVASLIIKGETFFN